MVLDHLPGPAALNFLGRMIGGLVEEVIVDAGALRDLDPQVPADVSEPWYVELMLKVSPWANHDVPPMQARRPDRAVSVYSSSSASDRFSTNSRGSKRA